MEGKKAENADEVGVETAQPRTPDQPDKADWKGHGGGLTYNIMLLRDGMRI